jgi:hypothetical protein
MLVLYETALGYCLFKVTDSAKIESADLWKEFESPEKASKLYLFYFTKETDQKHASCLPSQIKVESDPSIHINSHRRGRYHSYTKW